MNDLKDIPGPKILHCLTVKGKGYDLAEKDQTKWHAPGLFDKISGEIVKPVKICHSLPNIRMFSVIPSLNSQKLNPKIVGDHACNAFRMFAEYHDEGNA